MIDLHTGDCREVMARLEADSFDACVTDPPYHLTQNSRGGYARTNNPEMPHGRHRIGDKGFMGKVWDGGGIAFDPATWREVFRVLKPGAHLLAFGGTRTYHRMTCAIEDAGFEIRDCLMWVYGSGFPKSLDVSKAIDGSQWQGWGTALKPALEPIVLARKPLAGTVAENVLRHGTGALNIDASRIPTDDALGGGNEQATSIGQFSNDGWKRPWMEDQQARENHAAKRRANVTRAESLGRWPANLIHDGSEEVLEAFPDAPGQLVDASANQETRRNQLVYGRLKRGNGRDGEASADRVYVDKGGTNFAMLPGARRGDTGSAARFFYTAKVSQSERGRDNTHPTVKPLDLIRYLCKLITQPGGRILDPFAGSGSTGIAAAQLDMHAVLIDLEAAHVEIAANRIRDTLGMLADVRRHAA